MEKTIDQEKIVTFLQGILQQLGVDCAVEVKQNQDGVVFNVVGEDAAVAIGHRGETLDALQYLATMLAGDGAEDGPRVYVDAEGYREKRIRILTNLAEKLAYKAYKTRRRQALEPMNPYERRIIHFALQNSEYAETVSEGEGRNRHIVVVPKNMTEQEECDAAAEAEISYGRNEDFAKKGFGKMRSFGGKRRRF